MARTQARVSRSFMSTLERSFTACASAVRTLAERTSYCCAPPHPSRGRARTRRKSALRAAPGSKPRPDMAGRIGHGNLRRRRVAPVLVLDHAFLQAAIADHDAVRDADELLVGEQHAGALVAIVEERFDSRRDELRVEFLRRILHRLALAIAERDDGDRERRYRIGPDDALVVMV